MANPPPGNNSTKLLVQAGNGSPGSYDIYVDPVELQTVSTFFGTRLQAHAAKMKTFTANTPHQDGEFGKLPFPETTQVNQQYAQSQQNAVKTLGDLATWLDLIRGALKASANDYNQADGVTT